MFSRSLLSAAVVLGLTGSLVDATLRPNLIRRADVPISVDPECVGMLVGQQPVDGTICLSVSDDSLVVVYSSPEGKSLGEAHLYVGVEYPPIPPAPGQFPYRTTNGYCVVADDKQSQTCTVPLSELTGDICKDTYYLASHANVGNHAGWGEGECIVGPKCNPWATYSTFHFVCAPKTTPAPVPEPSTSEIITVTATTSICETSTIVSSDTTIVTTVTKETIITYTTCPSEAPVPTVYSTTLAPNATVSTQPAAPVPTEFAGGSANLGIGFGSVVALAALLGGVVF